MPICTALHSRCLCALLYCTLGDVYTALQMYDSTMYSPSTMYAQCPFLVDARSVLLLFAARSVLLLLAARSVLLLFCCALSAPPRRCVLSATVLYRPLQAFVVQRLHYSIVSASAGAVIQSSLITTATAHAALVLLLLLLCCCCSFSCCCCSSDAHP